MSSLFSPVTFRSVTLSNRIAVSPMCQYSSHDGFADDWHLVHLGSRAIGGAGLALTEAAAVSPNGRITPRDLGIWKDEHITPLKRIVDFLHAHGSAAGIQLAHAGRKASMMPPWFGDKLVTPEDGGWADVVAASPMKFKEGYVEPHALTLDGIGMVKQDFVAATRRAVAAGFDVVEIHAAHGYLLHNFLSPLSNHRSDAFGGSFENRIRLLVEIVDAVRKELGERKAIFVRISATDWVEPTGEGWEIGQSVALARVLKEHAVDLIDVSSGGNVPGAKIPTGPGYQVPFAKRIRREAEIATGAVGQITDPAQADEIIRNEDADVVLLAREMLRDPYWALHAAHALGVEMSWPQQYMRAAPQGSTVRTGVDLSRELN